MLKEDTLPDFEREVAISRQEARLGHPATGEAVVRANRHLWEGYARAGAQFNFAAKRVCEIHNRDLDPELHVQESTVKRGFQKLNSGWKDYCRKIRSSGAAPTPSSSDAISQATAVQPSPSLADNRSVSGTVWGDAA